MARHLVAKGYSVSGYDPHEPARRAAAALGVALRESARDVAAASELVIIVVGFDHEVETVMYGPQGVMEAARPDLIVAIGSTVAPRYAKRLAQRAGERGVVVLDAPLARGEAAALAGNGRRLAPRERNVQQHHVPAAQPCRQLLGIARSDGRPDRDDESGPRSLHDPIGPVDDRLDFMVETHHHDYDVAS